MKLVLIGPPAAGKGTQGRKLVERYGVPYLSTGDLLRQHVANETEIGLEIKDIIANGNLIPDAMIIEIVKEKLQMPEFENGYILDGFPRTKIQAEALEEFSSEIDRAIYISVPDKVIMERTRGRLSCEKCGASFNSDSNPPMTYGVCDLCNGSLNQRPDDDTASVFIRLKTFHNADMPLVNYYKSKNLLFQVNGLKSIDEVTKSIILEVGEKA